MISRVDINPNKNTKPVYGACISFSKQALAEILHFPAILEITTCHWNHKTEVLEITMHTEDPKTVREIDGIPVVKLIEGAEAPNVSGEFIKRIIEYMTDKEVK